MSDTYTDANTLTVSADAAVNDSFEPIAEKVLDIQAKYNDVGDFRDDVLNVAERAGWSGPLHAMTKAMKFKFNGIKVNGTAVVDFRVMSSRVWHMMEDTDERLALSNVLLLWKQDGVVRHPHVVDGNEGREAAWLCHGLRIDPSELIRLRDEGKLSEWLVGVVMGAYGEFNPASFANSHWSDCPACHKVTHLPTHRCANVGHRIGPTHAKFPLSILVGCGVTGSWMLPILSRVSNVVMVYDSDDVSRLNPNGRWSNQISRRTKKVVAATEPRYRENTIVIRRNFSHYTTVPQVDLVVFATDSAESRKRAVTNYSVPEFAWFVDIRVAGDQLVVWAFTRASFCYETWSDDIQTYQERESADEACGRIHHDNVPLIAGATAASFLSWWTTRPPEEGLWTLSLSQPWENQLTIEQDPNVSEAQRARDEEHHPENSSELEPLEVAHD